MQLETKASNDRAMRVILQPLLPADSNSVVVETNPEAVISSLVSSYCSQKNINYNNDFIIYDDRRRALNLHSTVSNAGITDGDTLLIGGKDSDVSIYRQWPIIIAFAALFIGLIGILTMSMVYGMKGGEYFDDFGVVMDAGSSKTNTIVYKWKSNKNRGTGCVTQEVNCYAPGGIAKMNPMHLEPVIDCAINITSVVPESQRPKTPLFFAATAGMRLLNITNPTRAEEILVQLDKRLPETNLDVKEIEIISGRDEGLYGWITVNFLGKTLETPQKLDPFEPTTYGALDMGGASMQISFVMPPDSESSSPEFINDLWLYGQKFHVYAVSSLCFGRDEAQNRYEALLLMDHKGGDTEIENPCVAKGIVKNLTTDQVFESICAKPKNISQFENRTYTFRGTSDSNACRAKTSVLIDKDVCQRFHLDECFKVPDYEVTKLKYMAFASFYFTTNFLNVTTASLAEYESAMETFCSLNLAQVQEISSASFALQYCFNANYIFWVLTKGFLFNTDTWENIEFVNEISDKSVGWSLGYMVNTTNIIPAKTSPRLLSTTALSLSLALFILMIIVTAVFLLIKRKKDEENRRILA